MTFSTLRSKFLAASAGFFACAVFSGFYLDQHPYHSQNVEFATFYGAFGVFFSAIALVLALLLALCAPLLERITFASLFSIFSPRGDRDVLHAKPKQQNVARKKDHAFSGRADRLFNGISTFLTKRVSAYNEGTYEPALSELEYKYAFLKRDSGVPQSTLERRFWCAKQFLKAECILVALLNEAKDALNDLTPRGPR